MMMYILKSSLCLILLWAFYKLFLEKENLHHFKRFYLLFSLIFAYTVPLITITYEIDTVVEAVDTQPPVTYVISPTEVPVEKAPEDYLSTILWTIYGIGVFIFTIRFIINIYRLLKKVRINEKEKERSHVNVLLADTIVPHTFLKYIFVPKKEFQQKNIPQEVMMHEKTHVQQKHTLDILFVEIFQIIFWFNPLWFWIKKSIRLNHEFLADQKVLKQEFSVLDYMNILVNYPNSPNQAVMASSINYSLTKKRIVMMSQQFSKTRTTVRLLLLAPLLLGCMLLFNNKVIAQQKSVEYKKTVASTHPDKKIKIRVKNEQISVNGKATKLTDFAQTIDQMTQQWKDNELSEFQFDIQILNSGDGFVQKLNQAYKKTRLYNANPDNHDLVPPPPPLPKVPVIESATGSRGNVPPPPKTINRIAPPSPPAPPTKPISVVVLDMDEIEDNLQQTLEEVERIQQETEVNTELIVKEALSQAEKALVESEIEKMIVIENAEHGIEIAMSETDQAKTIAIEAARQARSHALEQVHRAQERAHEVQRRAIEKAEQIRYEARERAMRQAEKARERAKAAMKEAEQARKKAYKEREKAYKERDKARKKEHKERRKAMDEMRKARNEARKEAMEAEREARKARIEAQKVRDEILEKNKGRR